MALRFGLSPNHLTDDPNDYMAVVTDNETVTTEQLIVEMSGKGSTVTKAEALSVIEEFMYTIAQHVKKGYNVNTELIKIYPSIVGVFNSENEGFDLSKHGIRLNINPGSRLREIIHEIEVKKVKLEANIPMLQQFTDLKTHIVNESFTLGQIASLKGSQLKFDAEDPTQGIFFIASAEGTQTRVENVVKNKPSELLFFIPESIGTGTFQVEVRTIYPNYKTMRTGRLNYELTGLA